jgi:hypothetical protein
MRGYALRLNSPAVNDFCFSRPGGSGQALFQSLSFHHLNEVFMKNRCRIPVMMALLVYGTLALACRTNAPGPMPFNNNGGECPSGYHSSGNACAPSSSSSRYAFFNEGGECPSGYYSSGNSCLASSSSSCHAFYSGDGINCPSGYYSSGNSCRSD